MITYYLNSSKYCLEKHIVSVTIQSNFTPTIFKIAFNDTWPLFIDGLLLKKNQDYIKIKLNNYVKTLTYDLKFNQNL